MKRQRYIQIGLLFIGALLAITLISPVNPLSRSVHDLERLRIFMPQGWGFFTKDPQSEYFTVYAYSPAGTWIPFDTYFPNSSPKNFFGLRRTNRAITTEVALYVNQLGNDLTWMNCPDSLLLSTCIAARDTIVFRFKRPEMEAYLPDTFAVVKQKPVPWSWRNTKAIPDRDFIVIHVHP